ncbi:uncharacterized protein LOC135145505 isoform X2 [Zophobas morio]|uniref:uncharacterized protein LOC135145505 isoform X2 n=1 Tax=Zophobas morio TaxID=2755281 RepID=UPI0030837299
MKRKHKGLKTLKKRIRVNEANLNDNHIGFTNNPSEHFSNLNNSHSNNYIKESSSEDNRHIDNDKNSRNNKKDNNSKCNNKSQVSLKAEHVEKNKNEQYRYGNYAGYYGYRLTKEGTLGDRLKIINPNLFEGKKILDVGCNTGLVAIYIAQNLYPKSVCGVDLDQILIKKAWGNLRWQSSSYYYQKETDSYIQFPISFLINLGTIPIDSDEEDFPGNVKFICKNFLDWEPVTLYDTILCFSVTKWIHLNWGDAGIKKLFSNIWGTLEDGGHLILEPQPWSSYRSKKRRLVEHSRVFATIQLKPDDFQKYLEENKEKPWKLVDTLSPLSDQKGLA